MLRIPHIPHKLNALVVAAVLIGTGAACQKPGVSSAGAGSTSKASAPAAEPSGPAGTASVSAAPSEHQTDPMPSASPSPTSPSSPAVPVGPGPQDHYTVASQPPAGSCHYGNEGGQPLPDPSCTPGATSPDVTQASIDTTICKSGYTSTIRPPVSVTGPEKQANAASYGFTGSMHDAEYDHLISLELGGDPNDPRNIWVEPPSPGHRPGSGVFNPKDTVENNLHTAVCDGTVTLAAAQQAIATDWTTAEQKLGIAH